LSRIPFTVSYYFVIYSVYQTQCAVFTGTGIRRLTRKESEMGWHKSDCSITAAELFSGIEEMAPRGDNGLGRQHGGSEREKDFRGTGGGSN
jgi:hypothetical protein